MIRPPGGKDQPEVGEGESMNRLLGALRVVAREEGAAEAVCPEDQVPAIPDSMRADIAAQALRQLAQGRAGAAPKKGSTRKLPRASRNCQPGYRARA